MKFQIDCHTDRKMRWQIMPGEVINEVLDRVANGAGEVRTIDEERNGQKEQVLMHGAMALI